MRWVSKPQQSKMQVNEDLVKTKPKPVLDVRLKEAVQRKKRARKQIVAAGVKTKSHGLHEDAIPAGTLCYLRKRAKEHYGIDFCTVLKVHVSSLGKSAMAEVLTPDGNIIILDSMWLRNTDVQNGNLDEDEE